MQQFDHNYIDGGLCEENSGRDALPGERFPKQKRHLKGAARIL
jgi:hypothetical protein